MAGGEGRVNILVIGSGGREHALCWALAASPLADSVTCVPGSDGIAEVATCVDIDPMDFGSLIAHCKMNDIDLVVVGPEGPLVEPAIQLASLLNQQCDEENVAHWQSERQKNATPIVSRSGRVTRAPVRLTV